MVYSMSALINDTIKLQNVLMILLEICLILEFILLFSRIMRAVEKWKKDIVGIKSSILYRIPLSTIFKNYACC